MNPQAPYILQGDGEIRAVLDVLILKNEKVFVAYCPGLNLSTYGDNEDDVQSAFEDAVEIFFKDTHTMGSLDRVLTKLGWKAHQIPVSRFELKKKQQTQPDVIRSVRHEYHVQYAH
ncbi:MAG: hypothetical protein WBQ23_07715 [Bacteroidota bacterium]